MSDPGFKFLWPSNFDIDFFFSLALEVIALYHQATVSQPHPFLIRDGVPVVQACLYFVISCLSLPNRWD